MQGIIHNGVVEVGGHAQAADGHDCTSAVQRVRPTRSIRTRHCSTQQRHAATEKQAVLRRVLLDHAAVSDMEQYGTLSHSSTHAIYSQTIGSIMTDYRQIVQSVDAILYCVE